MENNSPYEVIQLDGTSYRIEDNGVRCFLFAGKEKALLVDTGLGSGNLRGLVESITKLPVTLVNTHADGDHIGANHLFDEAYMHPSEFAAFHNGAGKGLTVKPLWEDDSIDLGGRKFEVVLIPGHTPGSIALLDGGNHFIITGDNIGSAPIYMFGQNRNPRAYIASMKKLDAISGRFDTVYPSHGDFPMKGVVFSDYYEGLQKIMAGEVRGSAPPREGIEAKLYDTGKVKFLY